MKNTSLDPSFSSRLPTVDDHEREICDHCGFINYDNPKIVVGSVATWEGRILLCRRAIDPRDGFWTLPAGYMEQNESPESGALREAWEEARARLKIEQLLATYAITRISQVQLIYRARLRSPDIAPGPESRDVRLFTWDQVPWNDIAFPSVRWALEHFRDTRNESAFMPRSRSDVDY